MTNPENLNVPTTTIKGSDYDYSMSLNSASLNIRVQPHTTGSKEIVLDLETLYPFINSAGIPTTKLPPYTIRFTVKPSRLNFINTDKTKFFYDLLKIEGTGLLKTNFTFSNCLNIKQDSTRIFDDLVYYSFTVPAAINKKAILIEMNNEKTKYELAIKENRHPKELGQ